MNPVYAIFLADSEGNFDWVYTAPKPYYDTREEAQAVLKALIEKEETITEHNSKVQKLWRVADVNEVNGTREKKKK